MCYWSLSNTHNCNRITEIYGHGEPTGKVCPWPSRHQCNSFAKTVPGTGMKLSKEHSSKSKRSLHHLKSLHITTRTVKQSLPQMHHQQGWEQFFFKNKIMDSVVQSATSPDHIVRLKGTMQSSRRKCSPQPGHANSLKSTSLDSGLLRKQITSHLFHFSLQPTCPRCPLEYCGSAFE